MWSSNGKVLARRAEATTVLHIKSVADVDRMIPSSPIAQSSDNSGAQVNGDFSPGS